ncbi:FMN-dependent NADH-azoreductase [Cognatishimia maritima]|uniref:FMN dependent NADH:quinone oxidoreductase n=1 Tax=Cognatishimia maritima TaxID=870908 RepID=A0A1M5NEV0_9RHOB|nr:NAD(P)H-dependent oxidoreductase [Cognatishimia maritima]SHG87995.1 FMN-dependent NADH-azoreductase [Cognatishimia maritima]
MTHTVLHIDASARDNGSVSRTLSSQLVDSLRPAQVIRRDLKDGLPFLSEDWVSGTFTPVAERSDAQNAILSQSDILVAEVQAADTIVIGTPIYNFSVPAVLKAWIDQIARAGVTFRYTENGPEGLLSGKSVIVAVASGGVKIGTDYDFATPYLKFALGFLGITDVRFVDQDSLEELGLQAA